MSSPINIQNYGFTKTIINDNNKKYNNEIIWEGNYDGISGNLNIDIKENGIKMRLNNDDLNKLLGIPSIETPLDQRLRNDFLKPIVLEGAMLKRKSRKNSNKKNGNQNGGKRRRKSAKKRV